MRATFGVLGVLALASNVLAAVKYLGVAMSGIDFNCDIDGSCSLHGIAIPLKGYGGGDGLAQMEWFTKHDKMNIFRLPATWQFLVNNTLGTLNKVNADAYDALVQACLGTGAYCMLDVHNFARYDGGIIGQGGPSNAVFANLWTQIAKKYAKQDRVVFGLMNEPHDLDIAVWAQTCQYVVNAIRAAGATTHMILLPGDNFASAETFVSSGSAAALANVTNPDGSTENLYMDLHKYLDINNSGSHAECTTDNVDAFGTVAAWLRENKRQAFISETGASMEPSCMTDFCAQNKFIADNSDVFAGFVAWSAGSFDQTYILTLTPEGKPGSYVDNKLMKECILDTFNVDLTPTPPPARTSTAVAKPSSTSSSSSSSSSVGPDADTTPNDPQSIAAGNSQAATAHNAGGRVEKPLAVSAGAALMGLGVLHIALA